MKTSHMNRGFFLWEKIGNCKPGGFSGRTSSRSKFSKRVAGRL